jgi:hypothetical protein
MISPYVVSLLANDRHRGNLCGKIYKWHLLKVNTPRLKLDVLDVKLFLRSQILSHIKQCPYIVKTNNGKRSKALVGIL